MTDKDYQAWCSFILENHGSASLIKWMQKMPVAWEPQELDGVARKVLDEILPPPRKIILVPQES